MPDTPAKFYLTTPIYYVNARPHIGHAYTTIAADVIARRHRLLGDDTFFLTGTDEHGQKVQRASLAAGVSPQEYADEVSASFQNLWKRMGILDDSLSKNDPLLHRDYIRTTDARHKKGVQKLFADLYARGFIELRTYTGQYCVSEETFVDGPPGTIGPDGKPTETVSEENFFFRLSAFQEQLIDLIESDQLLITPGTARNEVLSFIRGNIASVFAPNELRKSWADNPVTFEEMGREAVKLGRAKEYAPGKFLVVGALKDLSISRSSFTWGIPVLEPAAAQAKEKHVVYVWLDALANYITAMGYGSDAPAEQAKFKRYWPANLHLVGKEITRFHCVYWPAFLLAAGLPLPKSIVANGWLLFEESKMSKSRGNVVRTETILDAFGDEVYGKQFPESTKAERDLFAADVLRYFLLREIPFGQDGSFSFDALITRYNADLANGYGNLVSRTLTMIDKYRAGSHPAPPSRDIAGLYDASLLPGELAYMLGARSRLAEIGVEADDRLKLQDWIGVPPTPPAVTYAENAIAQYDFARALEYVSALISAVDAFISLCEPWNLAKHEDRKDQLSGVLYIAAESIRIITALLYPVMPYATASVWRQLGLGSIEEAARNGKLKDLKWGDLQPGTKLGPLAPIFPRADKGLAQIMTDMENPATPTAAEPAADPSAPTAEAMNAVNPASAPATGNVQRTTDTASATAAAPSTSNLVPGTSTITIDDFVKIDLRVAEIVVAERIPKADKLLRLEVDLGPGFDPPRRQILAGIAEYYAPETLIGRKVVIVANLAPRKMRGLESQGMIVAAAVGPNGAPVLAGFLEDVEIGARLK